MFRDLKILDKAELWTDDEAIAQIVANARARFYVTLSDVEKKVLEVAGKIPFKFNFKMTEACMQQATYNGNLERQKWKRMSEASTIDEALLAANMALKYGSRATTGKVPSTLAEVGVKGCITMMLAKTTQGPLSFKSQFVVFRARAVEKGTPMKIS